MSEFERQFPKPKAAENSKTMHRWLSKKIGYLAALKWTLTQVRDEFTQRDIEQEIAANVEKQKSP